MDEFSKTNVIFEGSQSYTFDGITNTYNENGLNYQIAFLQSKNKTLSNVSMDLRNSRELDSCYGLILYCDRVIGDNDTIVESDIKGYSQYMLNDFSFTHKIYKKNLNDNYELKYSYLTNEFNLSNITFIIENVLAITGDRSYFLILSNQTINYENFYKFDEFLKVSMDYVDFSNNLKSTNEPPGGGNTTVCGSPCPSTIANMKCVYYSLFDEYQCQYEICAMSIYANTLIAESAMSSDSVNKAFDTVQYYSFRDDFLNKTPLGQKYIYYYYSLSEFLGNRYPSLSLMIETAELLIEINPNLDMLIDTTGYSNSIVISSAMKTDLINLVNDYKALSTDSTYVATLNDIICDINQYSNKSVYWILDNIN